MNQNANLTWTIAIIAQVDTVHQWEFNDFKKNIEFPERVNNLRYVLLEYRQKKKQPKKNEPVAQDANQSQEPAVKDDNQIQGEAAQSEKPLHEDEDYYTIWEISQRYPILKKLSDPTKSECLADKNLIEKFFRDYVTIPEQKTDRYMLILWGHGAGLGFFSSRSNETKAHNEAVEKMELNNPQLKNKKRRLNRRSNLYNCFKANVADFGEETERRIKLSVDTINDDPTLQTDSNTIIAGTKLLPATDLSQILNRCFTNNEMIGKKKLNLLIANSCYTNMFECGYVLKDNVQVYAASESIVPFAGIDYAALFESLEDYPEQDPYELAYNITDTFQSRYTRGGFAKAYKVKRPALNVRDFSINVNSLEYYDNFFETINKLAHFLIRKIDPAINNKEQCDQYLKRIDLARSFCGDFAQGIGFIDFSNFFIELLKTYQHDNPGELKEIYKEFFFWKEKSLLSSVSPGSLFRFMPDEFYSQSPQLFSIFFPYRYKKSHVVEDIMKVYQTSADNVGNINDQSAASQEWLWPRFIKLYWTRNVANGGGSTPNPNSSDLGDTMSEYVTEDGISLNILPKI